MRADRRANTLRQGETDVGGGNESMKGHLLPLGSHSPPTGPVIKELFAFPSVEEMYHYVRTNEPFVVRGVNKKHTFFKSWNSDAYLTKRFGQFMLDIEEEKVEDRFGKMHQPMELERYLSFIHRPENHDKLYAVFDLNDDMLSDFSIPKYLRCGDGQIELTVAVGWLSNGGTVSVIHNDDNENVLNVLDGRKEVLLFHPREARNLYFDQSRLPGTSAVFANAVDMKLFPRVADSVYSHVTLYEGDSLFIPRGFIHQVNSYVDRKVSTDNATEPRNLAVNFWFSYNPNNAIRADRPSMIEKSKDFPKTLNPFNFVQFPNTEFWKGMYNSAWSARPGTKYLTRQLWHYISTKKYWPETFQCKDFENHDATMDMFPRARESIDDDDDDENWADKYEMVFDLIQGMIEDGSIQYTAFPDSIDEDQYKVFQHKDL
eukprot:g5911.t1